MTEPIKGIVADVLGSELSGLLKTQAQYHDSRAEYHETRAAKLKELTSAADREVVDTQTSYSSVRSEPEYKVAEKRGKEHRNSSRHLNFVAEHLIADAYYRLGDNELRTLGVVR